MSEIIEKKCGYFGISFGVSNLKRELNLYGFPKDYNAHVGENYGKYELYGNRSTKNDFHNDNRLIKHNIGVDSGVNGGPIFIGG